MKEMEAVRAKEKQDSLHLLHLLVGGLDGLERVRDALLLLRDHGLRLVDVVLMASSVSAMLCFFSAITASVSSMWFFSSSTSCSWCDFCWFVSASSFSHHVLCSSSAFCCSPMRRTRSV